MICLYNEVTKTPNTESQVQWIGVPLDKLVPALLTPWGDFLGPMVISTQSCDANKL